jgi:hypothetical protein
VANAKRRLKIALGELRARVLDALPNNRATICLISARSRVRGRRAPMETKYSVLENLFPQRNVFAARVPD